MFPFGDIGFAETMDKLQDLLGQHVLGKPFPRVVFMLKHEGPEVGERFKGEKFEISEDICIGSPQKELAYNQHYRILS